MVSKQNLIANPTLIWFGTLILLTVAMVVGLIWALRVWNDVKGGVETDSDSPDELLEPLAEAFAAGQMSEEEYRRIKQSVAHAGLEPEPPSPGPRSRAGPAPKKFEPPTRASDIDEPR